MKIWRMLTREEAATVPGMINPMPDSLFAVGAVDDRGVVACIGCFPVLHADPMWIREDHRQDGRTLLRLWDATKSELRRRGMGGIEVLMTEHVPGPPLEDVMARMMTHEKVGGHEVKLRTFIVPVEMI